MMNKKYIFMKAMSIVETFPFERIDEDTINNINNKIENYKKEHKGKIENLNIKSFLGFVLCQAAEKYEGKIIRLYNFIIQYDGRNLILMYHHDDIQIAVQTVFEESFN